MAKVTGPLYSMSASGKLANSMVFFGWKGTACVREWLKPANPKSSTQGDHRVMIGGTGRAVGKVQPSSSFHQQLIDLDLIPSGQTKQSYLVKYILANYLTDTTAYGTELASFTGHTSYSDWGNAADNLNITEFDLDYADVEPYEKGLGLYLLAKAAIALGFTGSPYDTTLSDWTATQIDEMVADFTG